VIINFFTAPPTGGVTFFLPSIEAFREILWD
jgi:hypothetical protein